MLNRTAIVLRPKEPFVRWVCETDPLPGIQELMAEPDEQSVYLVPQLEEGRDELFEWLAQNYEALFEKELEGWYTDTSLWPKNRTLSLFREWIDVEYHTEVRDLLEEEPLLDDGA